MPLARIITNHPELTTSLSQQLQLQGFTVQVARPQDAHIVAADLEIDFEVSDQQEALQRASELAGRWRTEVIVFPGAVDALKPAPVPASIPQTAPVQTFTPVPEVPASVMTSVPLPEPPVGEPIVEPEFLVQAAETPAEVPPSNPQPVIEQIPQPIQAQTDNPAPAPELKFLSSFGSEMRRAWQQTGSAFGEARRELDGMFARSGQKLRNAFSVLKRRAAVESASLAGRTREYHERLRLRAAEARAAREQRLAELEVERAQMRQQAATLEQERQREKELADAVQREIMERERIEREQRLAEMEKRRIAAMEHAAALERQRKQQKENLPVAAPPGIRSVSGLTKRFNWRRRKHPEVQSILTGAIAASFLFLVGLTVSNFRPRSPLPSDMNRPALEQQVPFGSATIHAASAAAAHRPVTHPQTSTARTVAPSAAPKPQPQHRHPRTSSRNNEADVTADDVVVRHFNTATPKSKPGVQQAGIKRYSDVQ